jgi:hypothetical protein
MKNATTTPRPRKLTLKGVTMLNGQISIPLAQLARLAEPAPAGKPAVAAKKRAPRAKAKSVTA